MIQDLAQRKVLILGCGNVFFGDDGFGPQVIEHLESHYRLPETILATDMGTAIKDFLFDLLIAPIKPERLFILDAVTQPQRSPGELFEVNLTQLREGARSTSPFHQFPSLDQIQKLGHLTGVAIRILVVQAEPLPDRIRPGLSPAVKAAIPRACDWLAKEIGSGLK